MKHLLLIIYTMAVVATSTLLSVAAVSIYQPADVASTPVPAHAHSGDELTLYWNTPVIGAWVTADGETIATDTPTTLNEYTDVSQELLKNARFRQDASEMIYHLTSDSKIRTALMRHGMTAREVDTIAAYFKGSLDGEPSLAYTEPGD